MKGLRRYINNMQKYAFRDDEDKVVHVKYIEDSKGYYAGDDGHIYRIWYDKDGHIVQSRLKEGYNNRGYVTANIYWEYGGCTTKTVHKLIFDAWHGIKREKEIDHINGNKADNRLDNLRRVSHSENMQHYFSLVKALREA